MRCNRFRILLRPGYTETEKEERD
eukprot:COSAG06_NODE_38913_length_418_cov_0.849530_1_plen_23_part_10